MIRNSRSQSLAFSALFVIGFVALFEREGNGFHPRYLMLTPGQRRVDVTRIGRNAQGCLTRTNDNSLLFASPSEEESDSVEKLFNYDSNNFDNEIDEDVLEEIELGQPPEWMVMQQVNNIDDSANC
jgi:hypothetical protein